MYKYFNYYYIIYFLLYYYIINHIWQFSLKKFYNYILLENKKVIFNIIYNDKYYMAV